jgi:hypothetical protein
LPPRSPRLRARRAPHCRRASSGYLKTSRKPNGAPTSRR